MKSIFCLIIASFLSIAIYAQSADLKYDVSQTKAVYVGTTGPLKDLINIPSSLNKNKANKYKIKRVENFMHVKEQSLARAPQQDRGIDPLRQSYIPDAMMTDLNVRVNVEGVNETSPNTGSPPDPSGYIGKDHYVQMVNATVYQVFDKEGNKIMNPQDMNTLWADAGFSSAGDPIVQYDHEYDRWILTEFGPFGSNRLLIAVSESSDPMGSYHIFTFGTPSFPDYPKYSLWSNALCITTNEDGNVTNTAYFIDRQALICGNQDATMIRLEFTGNTSGPVFYVASPVNWSGDNPPPTDSDPMIVRLNDDAWGDSAEDVIDIYSIGLDFVATENTTVQHKAIPTSPYDTQACILGGSAVGSGICIPIKDGQGLDGIETVLMHQVHYRNFGSYESILMAHTVNASDATIVAGIRWTELRRSDNSDWSTFQEGTWAPDDGLHRFMPSMAIDRKGNIGLAYATSSEDTYPSLRLTGRRYDDPVGMMTVEELILAESNAGQGFDRYGDYFQMNVDPVDEATFWFTGEYLQNFGFSTRVVAFDFGKEQLDAGTDEIIAPINGHELDIDETLMVAYKNYGLDTIHNFSVGYSLDGGSQIIEDVTHTLFPDSIYTHTFGSTIDLSEKRQFLLKAFITAQNDGAVYNDTLIHDLVHYPRWDASISGISGIPSLLCQDEIEIEYTLVNRGNEVLASVDIEYYLNDVLVNTFPWSGSLNRGKFEKVNLNITGLINGMNEIKITALNPNEGVDEIPTNDSSDAVVNVDTDAVVVVFTLVTDNWPGETTWELRDGSGNLVFSGGPYQDANTEFVEDWCLDTSECYTFQIFDVYLDGICCSFGNGSYKIEYLDGGLIKLGGEFAASETTDFCGTFQCAALADIDVSPESTDGAMDGIIMINASNILEPVLYSINGGGDFQSNSIFTNLDASDYDIQLIDSNGCEYAESVTIGTCTLDVVVRSTPESQGNDGTITIDVAGNQGDVEYSIDGGQSFFDFGNFIDLPTGDYSIVVIDGLGCRYDGSIHVDINSSIEPDHDLLNISVIPNPTEGVFRVEIEGLNSSETYIPLEVYSMDGKLVRITDLIKYDDTYLSTLSLVSESDGTYLVRIIHEDIDILTKIIKAK